MPRPRSSPHAYSARPASISGRTRCGRLDEDPAHPVQTGPRVALDRVGGEVLKLGERLEPGVAAADEDVGEQRLASRRVLGRVRLLERLDEVVADPDRVGEALEADRVLVEARAPAASG